MSAVGGPGSQSVAPQVPEETTKDAALQYLKALLGTTLYLYTNDGRIFAGEFKCTDKDRNIILGHAFEYRQPGVSAIRAAAGAAAADTARTTPSVTVDMTSRFMGLVVVPGQYITRIEVEEQI